MRCFSCQVSGGDGYVVIMTILSEEAKLKTKYRLCTECAQDEEKRDALSLEMNRDMAQQMEHYI